MVSERTAAVSVAPPVRRPSDVATTAVAPGTREIHSSDPVLQGRTLRAYYGIVALWLAANFGFWHWWLNPAHVVVPWFYALFSLALAYDASFLPTMYLFYLGQMRRPRPVTAPPGRRVALITLCVPAKESLAVIARQLAALVAVRYPHDSWVLDEGNSAEVRALAARLGVRYFSRNGLTRYNQPGPPFTARTKAGNVNAWLDAHGDAYEIFVQFDIDHRPRPDYLDRVLGYFDDPAVGWVQAPSLYGNLDHWVARGAAEQELVLQGPLQQGFYGFCRTPFIIGSHSTYRTAAVQQIGGFQPTRAEDHLDTVALANRGFRGVFVPDALAVGQGPDTFDTYLRQQFAWAYSMMQILFGHAPRLLPRCQPRQALQFAFAETWYTCWSTSMLVLFAVPLIVLLTGRRPASASLGGFVVASLPLAVAGLVIWQWSRRWQQPAGLRLSWRGVVLHVARWPIVFWALINVLAGVRHPYMITPKGQGDEAAPYSLTSQGLYLFFAWASALAIWQSDWRGDRPGVDGYVLFALLGGLWMAVVVTTNVGVDLLQLIRRHRLAGGLRPRLVPLGATILTLLMLVGTFAAHRTTIVASATWTEVPATEPALAPAAPAAALRPVGTAPEVALPTAAASPTAAPPMITLPVIAPPPATVTPRPPLALALPVDRVTVGAYDPSNTLAGTPLGLDHYFIADDRPDLLAQALDRSRNRRTVLVTLQSMPSPGDGSSLLAAVVAGRHDAALRRLAIEVRDAAPQVVLVRWGHEMDLTGLYPWSTADPALYRRAYRHVVAVFRAAGATNVRWVWSPAGTAQALAFYPGDDVVDDVGLTILADPGWDALSGLPPQSFSQLLQSKYTVVAPLGKPIIIAELGVSGTAARQAAWLQSAAQALPQFPLIRAIAYFEAVNSPNNRFTTEPDWRAPPSVLQSFAQAVSRP